MKTPICDFVRAYAEAAPIRLHMPGHKGRLVLGPEALDITVKWVWTSLGNIVLSLPVHEHHMLHMLPHTTLLPLISASGPVVHIPSIVIGGGHPWLAVSTWSHSWHQRYRNSLSRSVLLSLRGLNDEKVLYTGQFF